MSLESPDPLMQLVFRGECAEGRDPVAVREALARALKLDARRTARLFCGKPIIMKRNVLPADVARHVARYARMGAVLHAKPQPQRPAPHPAPGVLSAPRATAVSTPLSNLVEPAAALAAVPGAAANGWLQRWAMGAAATLGFVLILGGALMLATKLDPQAQAPVQGAARSAQPLPTLPMQEARTTGSPERSTALPAETTGDSTTQFTPAAAAEYKNKYLPAAGHKAFALTDTGEPGWVAGAASEELAREQALERCLQHQRGTEGACRVVDVNGQAQE